MIKTVLLGLAALLALWVGAGLALVALSGPFEPSGRYVDIGGRKLRLVCAGPKSDQPVIWMEAGAWGLAADFAAIQQRLAAKGYGLRLTEQGRHEVQTSLDEAVACLSEVYRRMGEADTRELLRLSDRAGEIAQQIYEEQKEDAPCGC